MDTPNSLKSKPVYRTPDGNVSPHGSKTPQPMSASLKERLKRTRRSFTSPWSVAKRLKIEPDEEVLPTTTAVQEVVLCGKADTPRALSGGDLVTDVNRNQLAAPRESSKNVNVEAAAISQQSRLPPQADLLLLRDKLRKEVREKTETLRRLKMAKMYRTKNDLTQLQGLISKWRRCSQEVLSELQSESLVDGQRVSLSQLIDHFGLQDQILCFNRTEEDFIDS